jgi:hypothetical protein
LAGLTTTTTTATTASTSSNTAAPDSLNDSGMSDDDEAIAACFACATSINAEATATATAVEPAVPSAVVTELNTLLTIRNGIQSVLKTNYSDEQQLATIKWLAEKPVPQQQGAVAVDTELADLRIMLTFLRDTLATDDSTSSKLTVVRVALL